LIQEKEGITMALPHTLDFIGMAPSNELESDVQQQVDHLQNTCPSVTGLRVTVHKSRQPATEHAVAVRVDVAFQDRELAVLRQHDDDVRVALVDAFDAVTRRTQALRDGKHRPHHHVRAPQLSARNAEAPSSNEKPQRAR
jgi:hypothetical protein